MIAEQSFRYTDTIRFMKYIVDKCQRANEDLTNEEKNLFNIGYKNIMTMKRRQWRTVVEKYNNMLEKDDAGQNEYQQMKLLMFQKQKIEEEIKEMCDEVIGMIPALVENTKTIEGKTFFLKIRADQCRYAAEASQNDGYKKRVDDAKIAYEVAMREADLMYTTHPIKLATALNYSVFLFDIVKDTQGAIDAAKTAFDAALFDLQSVDEDNVDETLRVMQLLKDNFMLWGVDLKAEQERNLHEQRKLQLEEEDEEEEAFAAKTLLENRQKDRSKKKRFARKEPDQ